MLRIKKALSIITTIIITIALDVILQEIFNSNSYLTLLALLESSIIVFATSKLLKYFFRKEDKQSTFDEEYFVNETKRIIFEAKNETCKLCQSGIDNNNFGIIKSSDLPDLEKKCSSEVWILAFDLHTEKRPDVKALVKTNLEKGIKYKYFISDNYKVRLDAKDLIEEFRDCIPNISNYEFYFIKDDYFFFINGLDIVIYDPMDLDYYENDIVEKKQQGRRAYISLKSQIDEEWYEVPLSDDLIDEIILMIQNHMDEVDPIRM